MDEPTSAEWVIGEWVTLDRELHPFEALGMRLRLSTGRLRPRPAESSADEETDDGNASAASANADPFAALEQQFVCGGPRGIHRTPPPPPRSMPRPSLRIVRTRIVRTRSKITNLGSLSG